MTQELINEQWESNFFYEGTFGIVYDYLVKGEKHQFSLTMGSEFNQKLFDKNPRLKDMAYTVIKLQHDILEEFTDLPNCIWDDTNITACEVIKKHIAIGNIRVDLDFALAFDDNFFNFMETIDVNLIVEDVVYKDLCKDYINENPDWKKHFKDHKQHEIEYDQHMADNDRRQQEVMSILAQHDTDIFGSNL